MHIFLYDFGNCNRSFVHTLLMGQTASIAAKSSWPQLLAPLIGATVARYAVPGKNMMLWGAATAFVLSYFVGIVSNITAQQQKCQKQSFQHAAPIALTPAVLAASAFVTMHFVLKRALRLPRGGTKVQKALLNPNMIFGVGAGAGVLAFIGGLISATVAANQACT